MTEKPDRIVEPDFSVLISECQNYIDAMATGGFVVSDHVFNAAMEAVFGETVHMWIGDRVFETEWEAQKNRPIPAIWFSRNTSDEIGVNDFTTPAEVVKGNKTIKNENDNE